jgi:FdhD protein
MLVSDTVVSKEIKRVFPDKTDSFLDQLAIEEPLEIQLSCISGENRQKRSLSVTMRTPGNDEELAVGFLFTEGIIRNFTEVQSVSSGITDANQVLVTLDDDVVPNLNTAERNFYTTSSCGVCGKSSIDAIKTVSLFGNIDDEILIPSDIFFSLPGKLKNRQNIFETTGGLHASAIFSINGEFISLREDVGRHNALDKLIGSAFLTKQLPLNDKILLLSGRASFELIQKAAMAGIRIVAAIGAPSSLAVELAQESGITLIGFSKNDRFNIYTGAKRIKDL